MSAGLNGTGRRRTIAPMGSVLFRVRCAALVIAVAGCGGGSAASSADAGDMSRADAGPLTSSGTIGPAGGSVALGLASITIPPGALTKPTRIRLTQRSDSPPSAYAAYSALYEFDPAGQTFLVPATVVLPRYSGSSLAAVYWSKPQGGGYDRLPSTLGEHVASAQVVHFSTGFVGAPVTGDASSDGNLIGTDGGRADATTALDGSGPGDAGRDGSTKTEAGQRMDAARESTAQDGAASDASSLDAGGCVIGGVDYSAGASNPVNVCQTCAPATATAAWSNVSDGTDCGAGDVCTSGTCAPSCAPTCSDGASCLADGNCGSGACSGGTCAVPPCSPSCTAGSACGASDDCTSTSCISGTCACTRVTDCPAGQACDLTTGTCGTACSDSQPCNGGCCNAGTCASGTAVDACGISGGCMDCSCTVTGSDLTNGAVGSCTAECDASSACHGSATFTGWLTFDSYWEYGFELPAAMSTPLTVVADGQPGATCQQSSSGDFLSNGTKVQATFPVSSDGNFTITVGVPGGWDDGCPGSGSPTGEGGSTGGNTTSGGGGGTAAMVTGGGWMLVAGGGGGAGGTTVADACTGEVIMGPNGQNGGDGTTTGPGAPGSGFPSATGQAGAAAPVGGGGGGDGYFPGGGGGATGAVGMFGCFTGSGGNGGNGSSFVSPGATNVTMEGNMPSTPQGVTITW